MKKIIFLTAVVCLLAVAARGAMTESLDGRPNARWWTGTPGDSALLWGREVEVILEAWTLADDTSDILTFPINEATISNAVNHALTFTEKAETFTWTFADTSLTMSSSTGIVLADHGAIVLAANQMLFTPVATGAVVGTVEGTIYYNSTDDKFYGRDDAAWVDFGASAGVPGGSDTEVQYNNGGAFDGISTLVWDDTNIIVTDDANLAFGSNSDWLLNYDESVDNQLLWITANTAAAATTDPMFEILVGTTPTANQQVFGIAKGTQSSNTALFTVDAEGDVIITAGLTIGTTFYQTAIASAAAGNVNLNIDAAGTGTMTFQASSTGDAIFTRAVQLDGDVTIGDASADNITVSGTIISNVTLDDGTGDSPTFTLTDATNETLAIIKTDNDDITVTIPADTDFEIVTGNLAVGNGNPSIGMTGEMLYVEGAAEFDAAVIFDSTIAANGIVTFAADTVINDQVLVTLNANDEEVAITGTATNMTAAGMLTLTMAAQDSTKHILSLVQSPTGDADNEFLILADGGGTVFEIEEGGTTTWSLNAASIVQIDGDATANTSTGGVLDIDVQSATATNKAVTITYQLEESASTAFGLYMDLNDDTTGAGETYTHIYLDNSGAGSADAVQGIVTTNTLDDAFIATLGAAAQALVIDATATVNTGTDGVIDIGYQSKTDNAEAVNIAATFQTGAGGVAVAGMEIELINNSGNANDILYGLIINVTDSTATGKEKGLYIKGAGIDAAIQCDTGYIRVGTGSSASETLDDDDIYVEGTLEVDGIVYADSGVEIDNTLLMTATVDVNAAEVRALVATPQELVAAPGAGFLLEFVSAILILDQGTSVFTEAGANDNLAIEYDNGAAVAVSETIEMTGFIDQNADMATRAIPIKDPIDATGDIVNKNLVLVGLDDEIGGNAENDSQLTIIITYRMHNVLGL